VITVYLDDGPVTDVPLNSLWNIMYFEKLLAVSDNLPLKCSGENSCGKREARKQDEKYAGKARCELVKPNTTQLEI
jgi:hypothetical protein